MSSSSASSLLLFNAEAWGGGILSTSMSGCCCCYFCCSSCCFWCCCCFVGCFSPHFNYCSCTSFGHSLCCHHFLGNSISYFGEVGTSAAFYVGGQQGNCTCINCIQGFQYCNEFITLDVLFIFYLLSIIVWWVFFWPVFQPGTYFFFSGDLFCECTGGEFEPSAMVVPLQLNK